MPIAATVTRAMTAIGWCRYSATGMARPPANNGHATCQTCSRVRSACRDQRTIATAAKTYGTAVIRPTWSSESWTPNICLNPLMIDGRKNASAYSP